MARLTARQAVQLARENVGSVQERIGRLPDDEIGREEIEQLANAVDALTQGLDALADAVHALGFHPALI